MVTKALRSELMSAMAGASHTEPLAHEVTQLFDENRRPLLRYLLSIGLTVQDGEEVVQEVFLALFQHLRSGKPRHNLRGWLFRVGHNQALKVRERRAFETFAEVEDRADGAKDPEQMVVAQEQSRRLDSVISALDPLDRACLALRAEGFRYREIAEIEGISLGSVAGSIERSVGKLARAIAR